MNGIDLKKLKRVVDGLEICSDTSKSCCPERCPYYKSLTSCQKIELMTEALELFKEEINCPKI